MPTQVFLVEHVHTFDGGEEDIKTIGVYSSRDSALKAVERLRVQKGFSEEPNGFCIDLYILDQDSWTTGYVTTLRESLTDQEGSKLADGSSTVSEANS